MESNRGTQSQYWIESSVRLPTAITNCWTPVGEPGKHPGYLKNRTTADGSFVDEQNSSRTLSNRPASHLVGANPILPDPFKGISLARNEAPREIVVEQPSSHDLVIHNPTPPLGPERKYEPSTRKVQLDF
ncbi:uncharacterized protein N7483_002512 [Penicillium malachiteum]|uniref:uncharacterized protein n=1 Tax=Penicillium malachiteum TaxID=1324776 RepID=UPI002548A994|nr:uncharacterized protein N7483_002512 [Penicillium malachiteum]KAJ5737387.1 hypothetical protein N7483_002512 [Penicillium malachiteum]